MSRTVAEAVCVMPVEASDEERGPGHPGGPQLRGGTRDPVGRDTTLPLQPVNGVCVGGRKIEQ